MPASTRTDAEVREALRTLNQPVAIVTNTNIFYGTITKVTAKQVTVTWRNAAGAEKTTRFVDSGRVTRGMLEFGYASAVYGDNGARLHVADDPRLPAWSRERRTIRAQIRVANASRGTLPYNATRADRLARAVAVRDASEELVQALTAEVEAEELAASEQAAR